MIEVNDILVEGENLIGRYTIVLLNQSRSGHWLPSSMQLDAIVTNYRLMLRPFRKRYSPASLPAAYIANSELTTQDKYHCVKLVLSTKDVLYMMLSTGKLDNLRDDLHAMKSPPTKFRFDDTVAKNDIERLISFFGKQPINEL